jgi:probable rRNA maturation factor
MPKNFSVINETKGALPRVPFEKIKNFCLGEKYELSVVFVKNSHSKRLNFKYRRKNKPTNVLSFSLDKKVGEIFLAPVVIKKQTKEFGMDFKNLTALLFIHGCLHLKGMEHGSKMEKAEAKILKKIGLVSRI